MRRIKKRYLISAIVLTCLVGTFLVWCKLDGVVSVHRGFRPKRPALVDNVWINPYLDPEDMSREPGVLFKQRLVWGGPCVLRVPLRDYGQLFQKARLINCRLSSADETWTEELAVSETSRGWRVFEELRWTDEFKTVYFMAELPNDEERPFVRNIVLPKNVSTYILKIEFELLSDQKTESFERSFTLRPSPNSYSSHAIDRMVAF